MRSISLFAEPIHASGRVRPVAICSRATSRVLLALALLLAPLRGWAGPWQAVPAAALPICSAAGGPRHIPDPTAPALPMAAHCDACLILCPALPVPGAALPPPMALGLVAAAAPARRPPPVALPRERARGPPNA